MNEKAQVALVLIIAVGVIYICYAHQRQLSVAMENASRPLYVTQNFISHSYSPAITNIESIEGNGHTIGNENNVQNEVA